MRFFRREIEVTLKTAGVIILIGLIVLPAAWGYEQRRQARTWQNLACTYRIKEVTRLAPFMANVDRTQDACATLARLGFDLSEGDVVLLPTVGTSLTARAPAGGAGRPIYRAAASASAFSSPSGPERVSTR